MKYIEFATQIIHEKNEETEFWAALLNQKHMTCIMMKQLFHVDAGGAKRKVKV